jgi:hypothetical protein
MNTMRPANEHMPALELAAELRHCWRKGVRAVRHAGRDAFAVAYALRL